MDSLIDPVLHSGPTLIGSQLCFLLMGTFLIQLYHYFTWYSGDKRRIKALVCFVALEELVSIVIIADNAWHTLIRNAVAQGTPTPSATSPANPVLNGMVAFCVQGFFAWRVYSLRQRFYDLVAVVVILLLSLLQFGASVGVTVAFIQLNNDVRNIDKLGLPIGLTLGASLACDTLITIAIVALFTRYRNAISRTGTRSILGTLTVNTIQSGALLTLFALLNVIFYYARPGDSIHLAIHWLIGRVYANVLLSSLNHRKNMRNEQEISAVNNPSLPSGAFKFSTVATNRTALVDAKSSNGAPEAIQLGTLNIVNGSREEKYPVDGRSRRSSHSLMKTQEKAHRPGVVISVSTEVDRHGDIEGGGRGFTVK
ncbi:hypothetical protein FA15DRAFT_327149 [Coprinopsis marcescibilis]|uniref:DUF6534 domain-containing protein n=1 Tax=Coprinopsis marcescibilis TaxID=230819 RepID=A0A5C3KC08_COPMA|nr:hypothetical protein FA15DRAFT_327149 [Coprinopsis marcescibilis]